MKKAYINPAISNVLMDVEDILEGSNPQGFDGNLDNNDAIDPNNMLSRRHRQDVWEDEEEFEEEEF